MAVLPCHSRTMQDVLPCADQPHVVACQQHDLVCMFCQTLLLAPQVNNRPASPHQHLAASAAANHQGVPKQPVQNSSLGLRQTHSVKPNGAAASYSSHHVASSGAGLDCITWNSGGHHDQSTANAVVSSHHALQNVGLRQSSSTSGGAAQLRAAVPLVSSPQSRGQHAQLKTAVPPVSPPQSRGQHAQLRAAVPPVSPPLSRGQHAQLKTAIPRVSPPQSKGQHAQLKTAVPPVSPPQSRGQHAHVSYKQLQASQPVARRHPPQTHAALVQQVYTALQKVPQARSVFEEAKQRLGQQFSNTVQLNKCIAQMWSDAAGAAELGGVMIVLTHLCVADTACVA